MSLSIPDKASLGVPVNYIENGGIQRHKAGWNLYLDAAAASPVDGTGGTPDANVTLAPTTINPLRNVSSLLLTKDAVNRQGHGFSYDFTIDNADKAKVLSIEFDYEISGTYSTGDVSVWIYDVTNGTLIPTIPYQIENVIGPNKFNAEFQTTSNSTSYRLIFHVASISSSAYTLKLDNVKVGPGVTIDTGRAVIVSADRISSTQTYNSGINTVICNRIIVDTHSAYNTSTGVFTAPESGYYEIKASTLATTGGTPPTYVQAYLNINAGTYKGMVQMSDLIASKTYTFSPVSVVWLNAGNTVTFVLNSNGQSMAGDYNSETVKFQATKVSSGSAISDNRVVATVYQGVGSSSLGSGTASYTTLVYPAANRVKDTHGAYNTSTGVFTAPVAGDYLVSINNYVDISANSTNIGVYAFVYKNNVVFGRLAQYTVPVGGGTNLSTVLSGAILVPLLAGETVDIRILRDSNVTASMNTGASLGVMSIVRQSGPSQIAASEAVYAKVSRSTTTVGTGWPKVVFIQKDKDTHSAFDLTSSVFTAPTAGTYRFSARIETFSSTATLRVMQLRLGGTGGGGNIISSNITGSGFGCTTQGTIDLQLTAGQTVWLEGYLGESLALWDQSVAVWMTIARVGL